MDLANLLKLAGDHAHRILIDLKQDQLMPSYLLLDAKNNAQIIGCIWADDRQKAAAIAKVKRIAHEKRATMLSFVTEAWMTDSRETPDALMVRPAEHPKRREFVFAVATDKRQTKAARWQIVRNRPGGDIIALVNNPIGDSDQFSGRITDGILP